MLSERAASYIVHQNLSCGKSLADISDKWNRTYPDNSFTVAEAEAFLAKVVSLRNSGVGGALSVLQAFQRQGEPVLKVVSTEKKKRKAPSKSSAKRVSKRM